MKASELRQNNLVTQDMGFELGVCKVIGTDREKVFVTSTEKLFQIEYEIKDSKISPIPLSCDWFDKAGFNHSIAGHTLGNIRITPTRTKGIYTAWLSNGQSNFLIKNISSVHELQNLCFVVNERELEFFCPQRVKEQ